MKFFMEIQFAFGRKVEVGPCKLEIWQEDDDGIRQLLRERRFPTMPYDMNSKAFKEAFYKAMKETCFKLYEANKFFHERTLEGNLMDYVDFNELQEA
jgi:hypothetical protein